MISSINPSFFAQFHHFPLTLRRMVETKPRPIPDLKIVG